MDLETLLARAHELDDEALAQIHDQYYPIVFRYARYRLDDEQLVEDIASEVFLRFLNTLHRGASEIRDLRAWLLGTTANLVNDHLRQKYRKPVENLEDFEHLTMDSTPEFTLEGSEQNRRVRQALLSLTDEQQHVLTLRFALDCSIEETARMMRKSTGAVKTLQFRAIASLRRLLERGDGE